MGKKISKPTNDHLSWLATSLSISLLASSVVDISISPASLVGSLLATSLLASWPFVPCQLICGLSVITFPWADSRTQDSLTHPACCEDFVGSESMYHAQEEQLRPGHHFGLPHGSEPAILYFADRGGANAGEGCLSKYWWGMLAANGWLPAAWKALETHSLVLAW